MNNFSSFRIRMVSRFSALAIFLLTMSSCTSSIPNGHATYSQSTKGDYSPNLSTNGGRATVNYFGIETTEEMTFSQYVIKICKDIGLDPPEKNHYFKELNEFLFVEYEQYQRLEASACACLSQKVKNRFSKEDTALLIRLMEFGKNQKQKESSVEQSQINFEDMLSAIDILDDYSSRKGNKQIDEIREDFNAETSQLFDILQGITEECFSYSTLIPLLERVQVLIDNRLISTFFGTVREAENHYFTDIKEDGISLVVDLDRGSSEELKQIFGGPRSLYEPQSRVVLACHPYNQLNRCLVLPLVRENRDEY